MLNHRVESARQNYIYSKPAISYERARIWTESHKRTEGKSTPDYEDVLFKKGFGGILSEAKEHLAHLSLTSAEDREKREFYESVILTSEGIIRLANRYAEKAREMAASEASPRKEELLKIAEVCERVPENPPTTFHEAIQFVWFTQLGGILSENPLALNPGRFDQFMYPYYRLDIEKGISTKEEIEELVQSLWLKYSEWVWTISANTADFFVGYNQFQNLTVGGKTREGKDATNELSYLCLKTTEKVKNHQPGLSVRIHQDGPQEFLDAVTHLVSKGADFRGSFSSSGLRYKDTTCCHEVCS